MAVFSCSLVRRMSCFVTVVLPNAGDCGAALRARSMPEAVVGYIVPRTTDKQCATVGATGVRAIAVNVSFVYVMEAGIFRDLSGAVQRFRRSSRFVAELEVGMEGGEVQRDVGAEVGEDPIGEFARLGGIIVQGRNHQISDLEPDIGFVLEPLQRFEHGLEMSEGDFAVEIFGEGLQVDIGGVNVIVDVVEGFTSDVAVGNHYPFQSILFRGLADVDYVFAPDGWLVVGKCEGVAAVLQS